MQPMLTWYWDGVGFMTVTNVDDCEGFKVVQCDDGFNAGRWNHFRGVYEVIGSFDTLQEAVEAVGDRFLKDVEAKKELQHG